MSTIILFGCLKGPEEEVERHESACFTKANRRDQARLNFGCHYCDFDASQKHEVVIHEATCEAKQKVLSLLPSNLIHGKLPQYARTFF